MPADETKLAMNLAYEFCEEQQRALDEGRITEAEWFERKLDELLAEL